MPAKTDKLDLSLQGAILDFGEGIAMAHAVLQGRQPTQGTLDRLQQAETRLLSVVRTEPSARRMAGIKLPARDDDAEARLRLRTFAFLAHRSIASPMPQPVCEIAEVAAAVMDRQLPPGEALLRARDTIGRLCAEEVLVATGEGDLPFTKVALPPRAIEYASGGRRSMAFLTLPKLVAGVPLDDLTDRSSQKKSEPKAIPSAKELAAKITEKVFGLDSQAEVIASRLVMHMTRARMLRAGDDPGTPNEVWIIIGPPAVGKTFICEVAGGVSGIPFGVADGSELSCEGYVGLSFSDTLRSVLQAAKGNTEEARFGLLAVDEFTKKARSLGGDSPVNNVAVQYEALRVISGQVMTLGGRRGWDRSIPFSTIGTAFALLGHCPGIDRLLERRLGRRRMGFAAGERDEPSRARLADALVEFGLIDELVSRATAILVIPPPSPDSLARSLSTEHGILASYNRLLAPHGAMLFLAPGAIAALAAYGMESGGYFRAMKKAVSALVAEVVLDEKKGTTIVDAYDVRRAIAKADGGSADLLMAPRRAEGGNVAARDDGPCEAIGDEHRESSGGAGG